jgi:hypothetical protein
MIEKGCTAFVVRLRARRLECAHKRSGKRIFNFFKTRRLMNISYIIKSVVATTKAQLYVYYPHTHSDMSVRSVRFSSPGADEMAHFSLWI